MADPTGAAPPPATCELCGEPMPPGEEMFKFHGYSGECPKPPLRRVARPPGEAQRREEEAHLRTIDQRDRAEEWADKLAYAVAPMEEIGEHSNVNNPWQNALDVLEAREAAPPAEGEALRQLLKWATSERADWSEVNADRYWQMNRVVMEIERATAGAPAPASPPQSDE